MTHIFHLRRVRRAASATLLALGMMAAPACSGLFDVEDPQAFGDSDLNNSVIIKNVADGAEGLLHQSFDDMIVMNSLLGDEMESTSTWIDWEDWEARNGTCTNSAFGFSLTWKSKYFARSAAC